MERSRNHSRALQYGRAFWRAFSAKAEAGFEGYEVRMRKQLTGLEDQEVRMQKRLVGLEGCEVRMQRRLTCQKD